MKDNTLKPLLLKPDEAAVMLAISPRTLWALTKSGHLPCVRIGRMVRYDPHDLIAWIDQQKTASPSNQALPQKTRLNT